MMQIEQANCVKCGKPLNLCEGDIIQIWQECLDALIVHCDYCGVENTVEIEQSSVKMRTI